MLFALNHISFSFGSRQILEDASWQIGEQERIGLVGPNGAGKSTLLRLMMGEYKPEAGTIQKANQLSLGFFNQDLLSFSTEESILRVGMTAFEKAVAIEDTLSSIMNDLESQPENEELLMRYSETLHDFELAGGYEMEYKAAEVLEGLGFSTQDLKRPFNAFSGGWRMRVLLARLMLQQPDILMLDEPTNHLDLPSIEWLEKYLQNYPGTVIIVSHDRYFLDRMVTRIVELFQQDLVSYSGNYSFFEKEKALRMEFLEREYENQQKYISQQERFIERFRAKASKAKQAQSLMKKLDKIERIELQGDQAPKMNISFDVEVQPGKIISEIKNLSKSYGELCIFKDTGLEILRGDKIALVGANGKGKSTLMRIISGMESYEGSTAGGHNVKESFYAQHQLESLNLEHNLVEELAASGNGLTELQIRQLLGCFLFSGDDVFKKIRVLSGGEKARVALAKVIAGKANFLMLDEPTNHLDLQSVELLIEALNQYEGTYLLISHDRYFVSRTANQFWEIEDGKIIAFKGTYAEWERWKADRAALQAENAATEKPVAAKKEKQKTAPAPADNARKKEVEKHTKAFQKAEERLNFLQSEKNSLERALADPDLLRDREQFIARETAYRKLQGEIDSLQKDYDRLFEILLQYEE